MPPAASASRRERFAAEGARVVGVDLREHSVGELSLQADVTDEAACATMFARVRAEFGRVDVLFNNAGISPDDDASVLDTSLEAWERVQAVNLAACSSAASTASRTCWRTSRRRLGHQHGLVRRDPRRRDLADLLHRLQGRRARALA